MNWQKYSLALERIIEGIEMPDYRRTLVNELMAEARKKHQYLGYWCDADPENADKIKAAFEALGFKNDNAPFGDEKFFFYTDEKRLCYIGKDCRLAESIRYMWDYKKLSY